MKPGELIAAEDDVVEGQQYKDQQAQQGGDRDRNSFCVIIFSASIRGIPAAGQGHGDAPWK